MAFLGLPPEPLSKASLNVRSLLIGLVLIVPLASVSLVAYVRWISCRWAVVITGAAIVATWSWLYFGMLTTNSSTAGLGVVGVVLYPWAVVGVGVGIELLVGRRGSRARRRLGSSD